MEQLLDVTEQQQMQRKQLRRLIGRGILFQSLIAGVLFYCSSLWMYLNLKEADFFDLFEIVFVIGGGFHVLFSGLLFLQYLIQKPKVLMSKQIQLLLFLIPLLAPIVPMILTLLEGVKNRTSFAFFVMPIYYLPVVIIAFWLFRKKLNQIPTN